MATNPVHPKVVDELYDQLIFGTFLSKREIDGALRSLSRYMIKSLRDKKPVRVPEMGKFSVWDGRIRFEPLDSFREAINQENSNASDDNRESEQDSQTEIDTGE